MNLTFTPQQLEQMECAQQGQDQFNLFSPDYSFKGNSLLPVNCEGKLIPSDRSCDKVNPQISSDGVRKRSLEDVRHSHKNSDPNIEYMGLVKRPKTPLITAVDIQNQVQSLSERKQSASSSLPDIICSNLDMSEPGASR